MFIESAERVELSIEHFARLVLGELGLLLLVLFLHVLVQFLLVLFQTLEVILCHFIRLLMLLLDVGLVLFLTLLGLVKQFLQFVLQNAWLETG